MQFGSVFYVGVCGVGRGGARSCVPQPGQWSVYCHLTLSTQRGSRYVLKEGDETRCVSDALEDKTMGSEDVNLPPTPLRESGGENALALASNESNNRNADDGKTPGTPKNIGRVSGPALFGPGFEEENGGSPKTSMHDRIRRSQHSMSSIVRFDLSDLRGESPKSHDDHVTSGVAPLSKMTPVRASSTRTPSRSFRRRLDGCENPSATSALRNNDVYVNVSDDFEKNPILANSVRSIRMREPMDQEDVERSLRVLGASRCWTDKFEESMCGAACVDQDEDDDVLATQTPIRSFTSMIPTSQSSCAYESLNSTPMRLSVTPRRCASPIGTPRRSAGHAIDAANTPNRYPQTMFEVGMAADMDAFGGARLEDMRKEEVNPMAYATVPKRMISEARMGTHLATLYKHFKNMCTFIRRSSMRSDRPYFKVVQLMVQRMTRKDFTVEQLRQMAWLAPNLITLKWVSISEPVRKRYSTEYKDCRGDLVSDIQIRIHRLDGKICSTTNDFENTCFNFKSVICAWVSRCEAQYVQERGSVTGFVPDLALPVPLAALPTKLYGIPTRDSARLLPTSTPTRTMAKSSQEVAAAATQSTAILSSNRSTRQDLPNLPTNRVLGTPSKVTSSSFTRAPEDVAPASNLSSSKRSRDTLMLPVTTDLLDTPGMRRIRENAKRLATEARNMSYVREHDVAYWKDLRLFVNALVDLSITDSCPPLLRVEWLAEFMSKYGTKRVTYDNVSEWANTIAQLAPDVLDIAVSKFDDYSAVLTLNPQPRFEQVLKFVNQQIDTCNK
ncbi:DNA replication factor CDT1 like family member protein [Babesia caballi]|uniref:DNA replication factor CDT1 like family member protein n=1 Tax=Babesia caballi TaxID=5871 RepID=A0AAV4LP06_BABCB|nr:DNA replication factor CDT1 like family member protein [Babesia caballi]